MGKIPNKRILMATGKIIICTYGFPPYLRSLGGAIRILKLAEYLTLKGLDVTVVCARTPHFDTFGYEEVLAKIRTITCDDPIATMASRTAPKAPDLTLTDGQKSLKTNIQTRLRQKLKNAALDAMIPDTGFLVVRKMRTAILREIASTSEPVTLITSGPPHSIHLVGKHIKQQNQQVNWIMDYRDSWNGTSLFRKKNALFQKINEVLERRCLTIANHLTYISSPMLPKAESIARLRLTDKATLISNGYDEKLISKEIQDNVKLKDRPFRLGYFGAIDHGKSSYRDPATIFRTLEKLPEGLVQLIIHGPSKLEAGWQERLGKRLQDGGKLAHADAIQRMFGMDALLLLHTREEGADEVVTGKVFEYISTGLPIISIGPANMAVNQLFKDDPTFYSLDHREETGLSELLLRMRAQALQGRVQRSDAIVNSFSRTNQHEKFLELLKTQKGKYA